MDNYVNNFKKRRKDEYKKDELNRSGRTEYKCTRETSKRCFAVLSLFLCAAVVLSLVLFKMEFIDYDAYQKKVIDQITVGSSLNANRGIIYDSQGNVLATNKTTWRVFISPVDIKTDKKNTKNDKSELIARGLSYILNLSYDSVFAKTQKTSTLDQTIKKGIDEETKNRVLTFISENSLDSMVHIEASSARYYPYGSFASHVIGFTGSDNQGLFGLEASYDKYLTGTGGRYIYTKDAKGNQLPLEYISYEAAKNGADIHTTIDMYIQRILEEHIEKALAETGAQNRITGIVMNVNDGSILGMATGPSYDLNSPYALDDISLKKLENSGFDQGSEEYNTLKASLLYTMWNNKAISEIYEPGSTFKVITASIAIDSGAVKESDRFDCIGYYKIGGYRISCHKKTGHGHGITFGYGLQQSCNPTMMQATARVGAEKFYDYYTKFGYLEKTGIDLPSEAKGIFHTYEGLGTTELATASFGQRFKVSPITHLRAIAAAANGGYLVLPHLVDSITDCDGNVIYRFDNSNGKQIISTETSATVSRILEEGVSGDGGARNAGVKGYKIAAKTGTSQKFDDSTGKDTGNRIGSCIAFAPSDNTEIAMIFIVDEPTCFSKYGSMVAAPYISSMMSKILPYLGYEKDYSLISDDCRTVTVGNYVGDDVTSAVEKVKSLGITCYVNGKQVTGQTKINGTVSYQTPVATSEIENKSGAVYLYTSDYSVSETVTVPNTVGKTLSEANIILTNAGFNIRITGAASLSIDGNVTVASQSLIAGSEATKGSVITLTLLYDDGDDG
ncbi:MAG: penicillin-binding transpeptidase domain-containing protein [Eubacteriales bacterium]|nr:penicillin-binding transpeptidase domain-containing protein [Eubacteriales bacterium]